MGLSRFAPGIGRATGQLQVIADVSQSMKALLLIAAFVIALAFLLLRPMPMRVIVFPNDFIGRAVAVQDPTSHYYIPVTGWLNREAIVRFPETGILRVADMAPFHWLTREKVMLNDGTILDGTHPWTQRPSRFRYVEVPEENSLGFKVSNSGRWDHVEFEVSKERQFDHVKPRSAK